ncbi:hypothetical protein AABB24_008566 [Solanum stoloniferum]|uniref:Uncharacterized protein n=2 Tax=Solanum TaxID=4107 RepID=A0AAF0TPZ0_SOLVR|nr:uncharacterized protein LOC125827798 isoform X1 [Solanum verrucosum]WMV27594.1 hypothetical protein MTR67_020979 [Solanum verrucosum]
MDQRSCNNLHFIQVRRRGLTVEVPNVDSHGKPALMFKKLKDIYDTENIKCESECLQVVDRTLQAVEPEDNIFGSCANHEVNIQSDDKSDDYDFGEITLKQLKNKCKSKKRKLATPSSSMTCLKQPNGCYLPEEDDDLKVPLSHLKSGIFKKANGKRRCTNRNLFASPKEPVSVKLEEVFEPEISQQLKSVLPEVAEPIADTSESEFSVCQSSDSSNCSSNIQMVSKLEPITITCSEFPNVVDSEEHKPVLFAEEQQLCTLNQIFSDNSEHVESKYVFSASEVPAEVNNQEDGCNGENSQKVLFAPARSMETVAAANDQSLDMYDCLTNCSDTVEISDQKPNIVVFHVPDATVPNRVITASLHCADDVCMFGDRDKEVLLSDQNISSVDGPVDNCISSWNFQTCSGSDNCLPSLDKIDDKEQRTDSCFTDAATSLISGNCLGDENQPLKYSSISEEKNMTVSSPPPDVVDQISTPELSPPPERLLSTRKAISPSSQERLCLAMNSIDLIDDLENYKCKEKLTFAGHEDSERSCLADASTSKDSERSPRPNQAKVFIGPKQISRRLKIGKRSSPPKGNLVKRSSPLKGNLEGPRLSRSLPQLSTGCTSIKRCSESAIAFSQRQMHDIESLASKLMNELKSMKDMVEDKLLFEAYRASSLKNDADEVKNAIKGATKVEETTRKWLSMMTRDCTRFCKIMKLTQNGATDSKNSVHREGRKISFADEAGGMLCHFNYFEDTDPTLESDSVQEDDI